MIAPSPAPAVDSLRVPASPTLRVFHDDAVGQLPKAVTLHPLNNVGAKHSSDHFCQFTDPSQSECFALSTNPHRALATAVARNERQHSATNIQDFPIYSRPNASPLQVINSHQFANSINNDTVGQLPKAVTLYPLNHVGAKPSGDRFCQSTDLSQSECFALPTNPPREKHSETNIQDSPIYSRPNASPLQVITPPEVANNIITQLPTIPGSPSSPPLAPERAPIPPSETFPELEPPSPSPAPQEVLPSPPPPPPTTVEPDPGEVPETITIERFEFEGNTSISDEELAEATAKFTNRPLSFAEVYEVRSVITELYRQRGYVTSGAIIPPQTFRQADKVVKVQIIEGGLETIEVRGTRRLNPDYIRSRLALAAGTPLNQQALIEALQLLQLDPLIQNISAELTAGTRSESSLLIVEVEEAKTLHLDLSLNNNRSPNIGTFERRLELTQANLFGQGDGLRVGFSNTAGSNTLDASYTYPLNPRNGTLNFTTSFTLSTVVESPWDRIDLDANSRYFGLTWRQPLQRSLSEEFAIGLSLTNQRSKVTIFDVPVRLSPGTEEDGSTTVTALRFFQEWFRRSGRHVFGVRSQFNLGLGFLGGTTNDDAPDSNFLAWRGQAQWVELLAPDTVFIIGGDMQLSLNPLLNLEQFGLGGRDTVRGYRQNVLLTDSGGSASAELRYPILRFPRQTGLLQIAPFIDVGFVWSNLNNLLRPAPEPNILASIGLGLRYQWSDRLSARLDWGIPLIGTDIRSESKTLQEQGIYFSVFYRIF